jgi:hypothetical protein
MKKKIIGILVCMLLIITACFQAVGKVDDGEIGTFGWQQDPDPSGWAVNATLPMIIADDFICNADETIEHFTFWGSWQGDNIDMCGHLAILTIYENFPVGHPDNPNMYDIPGTILWSNGLMPTELEMTQSNQGWLDPAYGVYTPDDHLRWWQFDCYFGPSGFPQTAGTHYWFSIKMDVMSSSNWGWKTALNQQYNCAVWGESNAMSPSGYDWYEVRDQSGGMLDMSFILSKRPGIDVSFDDDSSITYGNPPFDITNLGNSVLGVDWILNYDGGLLFSERRNMGQVTLESKETKTVKSKAPLFGIGFVSIKIDVLYKDRLFATAKTQGLVLGPFVMLQ